MCQISAELSDSSLQLFRFLLVLIFEPRLFVDRPNNNIGSISHITIFLVG